MKNVLLDLFNNFKCSFLGIIAIIGFFVQLFVPNINQIKICIPYATIIFLILLIIAILSAIWKTLCKYYKKTFKFIEVKQTESGNDVYWFESDYQLNVGDIIKLVEYNIKGTLSNLCIAKIQYKGEHGAVGVLPLIDTEHLKIAKKSSIENLKIKPIYINSEEIKQLLFLIKNDNEKVEVLNDK